MCIISVGKLFCTCGAGDDASYVRFGETKDKYFNRSLMAWHRNEAPKSAFWFGSVHTGSIGTGAMLVPGLGTQPYCYVTVGVMFWFAYFSRCLFYSRDLQKEEETMVFEAHCMSFPWTEILLFNYAKIKTVFYSMAPLINIILCEIVKCKTTVEMSGLVHDNGNFYKGCTT